MQNDKPNAVADSKTDCKTDCKTDNKPDNKRLFGKLCYLHRQMRRENNQLFAEYGVTPMQMQALIFIHCNTRSGHRVCQKDVERQINLRPSSVSTLISNLERDGFLKRTVSDGDARSKHLELTEKGSYICIKEKLFMDSCDSAIQNALSPQEQEELEKLLRKIIDSISN